MALGITFNHDSALLNSGALTSQRYYVRAIGCNTNTLTNTGYVPLYYKAMDENGQPLGDWLPGLPLPNSVPIMRPKDLMLQEGTTPFKQAYGLAGPFLRGWLGDQATVEDLL